MLYIDTEGNLTENNKSYTGTDGTKYPRNFPRNEIPGLVEVVLTEKPTDVKVLGHHFEEGVQVWDTRPFNPTEKTDLLLVAKNLKKKEIATLHKDKLIQGFNYLGDNYQMDPASMATVNNFMTGLSAGFENPHGGYYRNSNNVNVLMNDTELREFLIAIGVYYGQLRGYVHGLKDSVKAAKNQTELDAVDVSSGWPSN